MVIYGDGEVEASKDNALLLALEACKLNLPMLLCQKLALLDFEARKDAAQVHAVPPLDLSPSMLTLTQGVADNCCMFVVVGAKVHTAS